MKCAPIAWMGVLLVNAAGAAASSGAGDAERGWWPEDWLDTAAPVEESVAFALYTAHEGTLKLTAQLYPLPDGVDRTVRLLVRPTGADESAWREAGSVAVDETSYGWPDEGDKRWLAHFRVDGWDQSRDFDYRVVAAGGAASFDGVVRKDPEGPEIRVGVLSCNSNQDRGPRADIVDNLRHQDPDLLFFAGDQSYDHKQHLEAWLLFGRQFRDIMRDRPTITIPDDHDIGQGNVWGAGGIKADNANGDSGGYYFSPEYVNGVQAAQTWHLPDAYDPTPIERGIGVYYTDLTVGGVGFAVIEDRKFKTGPRGLFDGSAGRSDHFNSPDFDPESVDIPEARLLGDRQLAFLEDWSDDWDGQQMKAVLSQTVFANAAHRHGPGVWGGTTAVDLRTKRGDRLVADMDSNGWPQAGRDRALIAIRKGFATMLCGDQHLATLIHHGVNDFRDSGVSFVSPSIVNYYVRWWEPLEEPERHPDREIDGVLDGLGDYRDGFGNRITMLAHVNPDPDRIIATSPDGNHWGPRAEGYGLVRFDTEARTITYEVWPRMVDVTSPDAAPYAGWPVTMTQMDQYARKPRGYLPVLEFGEADPVVRVVHEVSGEIAYTLRVSGTRFQPHVFAPGSYRVEVEGRSGGIEILKGLVSVPEAGEAGLVRVGD
jgi:hypothetical protein